MPSTETVHGRLSTVHALKATRHGEHLIKLTRLGAVNCYLVREDDGFTLVDTGIAGSANAIRSAAQAAGARIARVALTHGHTDHTGSLDALAGELPDVEVAFPAREARFLRGDKGLLPGEPDSRPKAMVQVKTAPSRELEPGDRLGSLEVVAAPGHTAGQVAFLDTRDRTLLAGDAFATLGGTIVTSELNPRFPLPVLVCWDKPTTRRTARELRALEPSRLAVGHGKVLEPAGPEMDRAIAAAG